MKLSERPSRNEPTRIRTICHDVSRLHREYRVSYTRRPVEVRWDTPYAPLRRVISTISEQSYGRSCTKSVFCGGAGFLHCQRAGRKEPLLSLFTANPTPIELPTKCFTFSGPTTFTDRIQWSPLLIAHPHCEQSGLPPNMQGSTRLLKSAE